MESKHMCLWMQSKMLNWWVFKKFYKQCYRYLIIKYKHETLNDETAKNVVDFLMITCEDEAWNKTTNTSSASKSLYCFCCSY